MRFLAIAAALLFALALPAVAAGKGKSSKAQKFAAFAKEEELLSWIQDYRLEPQPDRLPTAVNSMRDLGVIRDPDTSGVYVGFVAGVLADNPAKAEQYITRMFPMPPEDQALVVRAIAYSGLPDWKALLGKFVERMPARRVLIDRYVQGKEKGLAEIALDSGPASIDAQWGYYFATGSYAPILRIVSALPWADAKSQKDLNKLTMGSMAKWTLATNASRNKTLLDFCRAEVKHQSKDVQPQLKEVVEAAQSYETGKIRKDAVVAIEELKRRGPTKDNTWAFAANATSTVIAVGCDAAAAAGQVYLGVPCIVTGALSSGAAKFLGSQ